MPPRVGSSLFASLAFAAVIAVEHAAMAHDARVAVDLDSEGCVAQEDLRREVEARGAQIAQDAPVRLRVRVDRASGVLLDVTGERAEGALSARRLVAASCAEALVALALVVALAADEPAAAPPPDPERPPAAPPAPPPAPPPVARDAPSPPAPAARSEVKAPRVPYVAASLLATSLAEGQAGARLAAGLAAPRTWLPWVEASASLTLPRAVSGGGGDARLTWAVGRLSAAPVGVAVSSGVHASAYAAAEAGVLFASGEGPTRTRSSSRPWLAAAAGARVRGSIGSRFFTAFSAGAIVPVVRDELVFLGGGTAYRVPVVGAEGALSFGGDFP